MFTEEGILLNPNEDHNWGHQPTLEDPCSGPDYCPGGHNSHKSNPPLLRPQQRQPRQFAPPTGGPVVWNIHHRGR
jgi:hypothetical protein